jgi:pyruvate,water dikinase
MSEFIKNCEAKWVNDKERIRGLYKPIQEVDIEKLSLMQLRKLFDETYDVFHEIHILHGYWMYPLFLLNQRFIELCKELAGIEPNDPIHAKLRGGFDNTQLQINREQWLLAKKATEMGLADLFRTIADNEQLMTKLKEDKAGQKWFDDYMDFIKVWGWRSIRFADWASVPWVEQPSLGLPDVKHLMAKVGEFSPDVERKRLSKEREHAEKELLAKIPAQRKESFSRMIKVAQMASWWSEDHTPYCELAQCAVTRRTIWEIGRRFAEAGVIDEQFDIFMLMPWEIRKAIVPLEKQDYRRLARWRKEEWQKALKTEPTMFIGQVEKLGELAVKDPVRGSLGGAPIVRPELKADLYGTASAPGVAEGIARVLMGPEQIGKLEPGEILVAPLTGPPWIAAFHLVRGVVTDMGGSLSHVVIMGREFGIPVIAGTMESTRKIKTGQRIRVDGDNCAVFVLDK